MFYRARRYIDPRLFSIVMNHDIYQNCARYSFLYLIFSCLKYITCHRVLYHPLNTAYFYVYVSVCNLQQIYNFQNLKIPNKTTHDFSIERSYLLRSISFLLFLICTLLSLFSNVQKWLYRVAQIKRYKLMSQESLDEKTWFIQHNKFCCYKEVV